MVAKVNELTNEEIGTIQAAVENLRSANKDEHRVEAAWRIAYKLEQMVKRLSKI